MSWRIAAGYYYRYVQKYMKENIERFYGLIAFSMVAALGCYYWIVRYIFEAGNPQKDELITGFMMVASLSSPLWFGVIVMALFRYKKLNRTEIIFAILPAVMILIGFGLLMLMKY